LHSLFREKVPEGMINRKSPEKLFLWLQVPDFRGNYPQIL